MENTENNVASERTENRAIPFHDAVFAWVMFALSFVFTHFCVRFFGGLWGGIFWGLVGISTVVFARFKRIRFSIGNVVILGISEIFCLVPIFSASGLICFLAAAFSFVLDLYLMLVISGAEPFGKHFVLDALLAVFERPFERFIDQPIAAFSVFRGAKRAKNFLFALVGLVIAVPLTIVVVLLLAESDANFEKAVGNIFGVFPKFSFLYIVELLFAIPVSMYLFGALRSMTNPAAPHSDAAPAYRIMPPVIAYFAVSPICVFYLIYTVIQINNIASIAEKTVNYSEFARKGFFELCAIAVINLFVMMIMQLFVKRAENDKKPVALRVYTIMISVFTLGIIATALTKMFLYVGEFGMTLLRVYTSWFMILLAFIFVTMIIFQLWEIPLWKALFCEFTAMFFVLCFGNLEGNIAKYNISAFRAGNIEQLDISEFYELGFAAVKPASSLTFDELGKDYGDLSQWYESISEQDFRKDKFAYFSIPRVQANAFLGENFAKQEPLGFVVKVYDSLDKTITSVTANIYRGGELTASETASPAAGGAFPENSDIIFDFPYSEISGGEFSGELYVDFDIENTSDLPFEDPLLELSYPEMSNFSIVSDGRSFTVKEY